ncbi:MAG: DUF3466 family protein [Puniceicoccales bacterium]|nr:DUF3466 family protein [Puniceicoccales bacterium]
MSGATPSPVSPAGTSPKTSRSRKLIPIVGLIIALLAIVVIYSMQPKQGIVLGTLGGQYSLGSAINDKGTAVGSHSFKDGRTVAFVWTELSGMQRMNAKETGLDHAVDINNFGWIVGWTINAERTSSRAFIRNQKGETTKLGTMGRDSSFAWAINDRGDVVGYVEYSPFGRQAFLYTQERGMRSLGTLGGDDSEATGINNDGTVVGFANTKTGEEHASFWTEKTGMADLETLGGTRSKAWGINDAGCIVGESLTKQGETHAFIWTEKDGMMDLGTLGGDYSCARAINDSNQVVGSSTLKNGSTHAFFWSKETGMVDLGTAGADHSHARDINNAGQIVGHARYDDPWWLKAWNKLRRKLRLSSKYIVTKPPHYEAVLWTAPKSE